MRLTRWALAIALAPLLVSAVALVVRHHGDYLPISDQALIEMKVRDIGHHPVVTGLYSRNEWSHPGPLLFYLLWPVYRIGGSASIAIDVGTLAINGATIAGMVLIARRRGGTTLGLIVAASCALVVRALGVDLLNDPWNTHVTVLPFALLVMLVWSMACGETWALPVGALVASFLAQTHIGFVVLAVPMFAFGAAWLTVTRRRQVVMPAALSVAVVALAWLPVLFSGDNLSVAIDWFRDSDEATHTVLQGWRVASAQLALPFEWLTSHRAPFWLTGEPVSLYRTAIPVGLPILLAAMWSLRRRRDAVALSAALATAFVLAIVAVWRTVGLAFDYRLRWTWVLGLLSLIVVGWAASVRWRRPVAALAIAALVGASVVSSVVATRGETPRQADSDVVAAVLPGVLEALGERRGQVIVDDGGYALAQWYTRSLLLQVERRGFDARMPRHEREVVGEHRIATSGRRSRRLVVAMDGQIERWDADPSLRRVASWTSVTRAQVRAHERLVERLDAAVSSGDMDPATRAKVLHDEGLQVHDPAVAWALTIFLSE